MTKKPVAFMSYVRFDDAHEDGRLSEFRKRLSSEVRIQTGEEFPIFQDRNDIHWGQNWKERLEDSLDEVTFLISMITPSFFKSQACRAELERFLSREKELDRNDLILPIYYVASPTLDDETKRSADELAQVIASRQYADWRELRFEPLTSPQVGKIMAQLAIQVRESLERVQSKQEKQTAPPRKTRVKRRNVVEPTHSPSQVAEPSATDSSGQRSVKTEPPTRVVDPLHRGDHVTISEAIKAAKPGDRILVRPGFYQEGIVIDKPLEIIGDGQPGDVIIQASGQICLVFKTTMGRVTNLTLRQMGGGNWFCVDIAQGRLELEDCEITSQGLSGVVIRGGASPRLRRNHIRDCKQAGVVIDDNGLGSLEDNDIFGHTYSGVQIMKGSDPTLRRNRIHGCNQDGIFVTDNGKGTIEENEIFDNAYSNVELKEGASSILRRNRIRESKQDGVLVWKNSSGTLEDNDIVGNRYYGIEVREGGNPTVRLNRINKNTLQGVWIHANAGGTYEDNDLRENGKGTWLISDDSKDKVKRARNVE